MFIPESRVAQSLLKLETTASKSNLEKCVIIFHGFWNLVSKRTSVTLAARKKRMSSQKYSRQLQVWREYDTE
jgi:hypothetical protein